MGTQKQSRLTVLIDSNSLQARVHRGNERLCTLLSHLRRSHIVEFSVLRRLTSDQLMQRDVLIIMTQHGNSAAYTPDERAAIEDFIRGGGGLLLMSNHGRGPRVPDTRASDQELVHKLQLGIEIENTCFRKVLGMVPTVLAGDVLNSEHAIISGASSGRSVNSIVTNTCSSIRREPGSGEPLVYLSDHMENTITNTPPSPDRMFAHALEASEVPGLGGGGRIVTVADSGFIGSIWTQKPGQGLARWGDNLQFVDNALRWLVHILT